MTTKLSNSLHLLQKFLFTIDIRQKAQFGTGKYSINLMDLGMHQVSKFIFMFLRDKVLNLNAVLTYILDLKINNISKQFLISRGAEINQCLRHKLVLRDLNIPKMIAFCFSLSRLTDKIILQDYLKKYRS